MFSLAEAGRFVFDALLDFIYPSGCLVCDRRLTGGEILVCLPCWLGLPRLAQPYTEIDGLGVLSVWEYSVDLHVVVHAMKYHRRKVLTRYMGQLMAEVAAAHHLPETHEFLVPVPLHRLRQRERGYNQSELLAGVVAAETGMLCLGDALQRRRYTGAQAKLGKQARASNIRGAFSPGRSELLAGRRVVLVDDVVTTGATLLECTRVLRGLGVTDVMALTAARTGLQE